ncbi:5-formyltetrahydrofolate cyclo-ligase [Altericista sp. CCNU0014]|uniref:5-formyltetrahydrofolate cyclo-ligase n=1 Tax=Altericista sp. CCNU0014 TaxID=3082949 RepID=UPI003850FF70
MTRSSDIFPTVAAKKALRKQLLAQRRALTADAWKFKSDAICLKLAQSEWVQNAQTILVYWGDRQEPDLRPLWEHHFPDKQWGLPRCVEKQLVWHRWQPMEANQLQPGPYGILEPLPTLPILLPSAVDLILVPAVGCDRRGFRLGYGGGFYDRLFGDPAWANIPTIGIVFEFAFLAELTPDPWDYPLKAVCTELGMTLSRLRR